MSGVITREIAEQFLTDVDSVLPFRKDAADLKNFTSLTDDAAEPLSRIKDNLDLSGLTEISVEVAISLAKHQGTRLDLSGFATLPLYGPLRVRRSATLDSLSGLDVNRLPE